jgi:UDP-N-acetylglucosamine--N-acetylmuramyl-(pentapeptide) pyrophosphoryl-undecaprenol N-acetylglucosamine transferase
MMIVVAAGGTGGHLFPAQALASYAVAKGHALGLITDVRGVQYMGGWPAHEHLTLPVRNPGGGFLSKLKFIFSGVQSLWPTWKFLQQFQPKAVVCFGGYPTLPAGILARLMGIPLVVHEQNALMGRSNRLLSRLAQGVALSFANTRRVPKKTTITHTGNPVRSAFQPTLYPDVSGAISIFVVGGSQGAKILADAVPTALSQLSDDLRSRVHVVQQARAEDVEAVRSVYVRYGINAVVAAFFDDMPVQIAKAHVVIARSGASTLAELAVVGRPAVLIPFAAAADDHQFANAKAFTANGAGWIATEPQVRQGDLQSLLQEILSQPVLLQNAAKAAAAQGQSNAAANIWSVLYTHCT